MTITYFQLFDKVIAPTNGDVPVVSREMCIPDTGEQATVEINADDITAMGLWFSAGCAYGLSSTPGVYTAETANVNLIVNATRARL